MEVKQLAGAVANARKEMKSIHKSKRNRFHGYDYSDLEDILKSIETPLANNGLVVMTSTEEVISEGERSTKGGGTEYVARVKLKVTVLHTSGEYMEFFSWGEGQDGGDKGTYKAITGARKYALCSIFNLATTDDPEEDAEDEKDRQPVASPPAKKQSIFGKYSDAIAAAATEQDLTDLYGDFSHNKILKDDEKKKLIGMCGERKAVLRGRAA